MVVTGQIVEMFKQAVQDKIVVSPITANTHERSHLLHIGAKDNGSLLDIEKLFDKPALTYLCLKQIIQAQFRLVLPLHLAGAGVVDHEEAAICQQNPGRSGAANK